ncbi:Leucine rich repeat N-terminal domain containing protein, putative [Angomonas deanei]|uniref:Leucine rich repeat N-terminal domain containing protein, putative n=1 Tax=Angomonas deanei TaxID=59799 RepID=A0A7G2C2C1_9TRYP|nr:Leucine rich repeat N-terminal domain containing protein, putative [Angomonas deanei]
MKRTIKVVALLAVLSAATAVSQTKEATQEFMNALRTDLGLTESWTGDDYCNWPGVGCEGINAFVGSSAPLTIASGTPIPNFDDAAYAAVDFSQVAVAGLSFLNSGLTGTLPSSWSKLTSLTFIDFSDSIGVSGVIPDSWAALTELASLGLARTSVQDDVFIDEFSAWTKMEWLDVTGTSITGSIPASYSSWAAMLEFYAAGCTGLVGAIPDWSATLTILDLSDTGVTGTIPTGYGSGPLEQLDLGGCTGVTGEIPAQLATSTTIEILHLGSSGVTGSIPDLSGMTILRELDLSLTGVTGVAPALPPSIVNANFERVALTGAFPTSWAALSKLVTLNAVSTTITGPIPDLSGMTVLRTLLLTESTVDGALPTALPPRIVKLSLDGTAVTGGLPDSWSKYTTLQELSLADTALCGSLPPSWGETLTLTKLRLPDAICGCAPASWKETVGAARGGGRHARR